MEDQKQQVAARVKEANNILVTVSANPSVDQLSACIGLTVALNKLGKHATAVFSGQVPSTIEFLQPEKTLEKNTDSLRDFIISLDKSKADKLRYKVEDKVVKIFITPYKTSISDKDLEFSQGDFNVDVVLAIGVQNQADLDQAITAHGRILHDAKVVTINTKPGGELGSINWLDPTSSSLSELAVQLIDLTDKSLLDTQISTALLTGIVAETERFSNNKTTPRTMTLSAELMTAGANQQLVATKLEAPAPPPPAAPIAAAEHHDDTQPIAPHEDAVKKDDGTLEIVHDPKAEQAQSHSEETQPAPEAEPEALPEPQPEPVPDVIDLPEPTPTPVEPQLDQKLAPDMSAVPEEAIPVAPDTLPTSQVAPTSVPSFTLPEPTPVLDPVKAPQIHIDEHGSLSPLDQPSTVDGLPSISHHDQSLHMITEPPTMGGPLNSTDIPESYDPSIEPLTVPSEGGHVTPSALTTPVFLDVPPSEADGLVSAAEERPAEDSAFSMPYEALESEPAPSAQSTDTMLDAAPEKTLEDIERDVHSTHLDPASPAVPPTPEASVIPAPMPSPELSLPVIEQPAAADYSIPGAAPAPTVYNPVAGEASGGLDSARDAVMDAINASPTTQDSPLPPVAALNAQPIDLQSQAMATPDMNFPMAPPAPVNDYSVPPMMPATMTPPATDPYASAPVYQPQFAAPQPDPTTGMMPPTQQPAINPAAPPPVPPPMPMMPPTPPYNQPY